MATPTAAPDWSEPLARALTALNAVPIGDLESLTEENQALIEKLVEIGQKRLQQAAAFRAA